MRVTGAYVEELGPTGLIRYGGVDVADPGPSDVLIEAHALTVNPVDTFVRSGRFPTRVQLPLLLGRDVVGRVLRAPSGSRFRDGEWVWANSLGYDGRQGAYADVVVAPVERVYPLPPGWIPWWPSRLRIRRAPRPSAWRNRCSPRRTSCSSAGPAATSGERRWHSRPAPGPV